MMQRVDAQHAREQITALLIERDRDRGWLARRMGMAYTHVWRTLAGRRPMSLNFARRAAVALELPEEEFVEATEEGVA